MHFLMYCRKLELIMTSVVLVTKFNFSLVTISFVSFLLN